MPSNETDRDRVLAARAGASIRAAAKRFGVGPSGVAKMVSRERDSGKRGACARRSHRASFLAPHREAPWRLPASENNLKLLEICGWLELDRGVVVSPAWMSVSLRRFGPIRKTLPLRMRTGARRRSASTGGVTGMAVCHRGRTAGVHRREVHRRRLETRHRYRDQSFHTNRRVSFPVRVKTLQSGFGAGLAAFTDSKAPCRHIP